MAKIGAADKVIKIHDELCNLALGCRKDVLKFARGNATAGIRVRAMMQDIRDAAKNMRDQIQKIKKARKQEKQDAKES